MAYIYIVKLITKTLHSRNREKIELGPIWLYIANIPAGKHADSQADGQAGSSLDL